MICGLIGRYIVVTDIGRQEFLALEFRAKRWQNVLNNLMYSSNQFNLGKHQVHIR